MKKEKPKYKIVEDYILEKIRSGSLKPGDQVETEIQLSEKFNIGRLTVNKALINLANNGYIKRIAGRGSFVLAPILSKNLAAGGSFSEDMRSIGAVPGSKLIEYKIITAKDHPLIKEYLNLNDEDLIHYFIRVRTADGSPIAVSYTYISVNLVPSIDINALNGSLKEYLLKTGFNLSGGAIFKMSAHLPTEEQKKLLNINEAALLLNAHISYTSDTLPYEYVETYYLCNQYEYTFSTVNLK